MINYKATFSHAEIARKLGLSRSQVISIEKTALRKIRIQMISKGYLSIDEINPSNNPVTSNKSLQKQLQSIKKAQ